MAGNKHTPGPWAAGRPDMATIEHGVKSKWIYANDQYVALASGQIKGDWGEVMANAHLIAAAPDLLAACEAVIEHDKSGGVYLSFDEVVAICRAAIQKARG